MSNIRLVLIICIILIFSTSMADIPKILNYQGRVTDSGGSPIADGDYTMTFAIYDAASGGTSLWSSGDVTVTVSNSVFSVFLGESPQPSLDLDFSMDYWIEITIEGDLQSPRTRLGSAGYAFMASGLVPGTEVIGPVTGGICSALVGTNTATTGYTFGVGGESNSTLGVGVGGNNTATTGTTYGVWGSSASIGGTGVFGVVSSMTGSTYGLSGMSFSTSGTGVYGYAIATAGNTYGVQGLSGSSAGKGVYGYASATAGNTFGVYGTSLSSAGVGVYGEVLTLSGVTYGVYGKGHSDSGYGVYYSGGLAGTGTKSCVVKTSKGPVLMYCQESPENWFEDFGEGQLVNGRCHIELDPLFLETVTVDEENPMKVFVELEAEYCNGVAIRRGITGFDVIERHGGTTSSPFWYRVVAKRKSFESKRLDYCRAAESDPYLFPKLRDKELQNIVTMRIGPENFIHGDGFIRLR